MRIYFRYVPYSYVEDKRRRLIPSYCANSLGLLGCANNNGYTSQLDSRDDQRLISEGFNHAHVNHYKSLRK